MHIFEHRVFHVIVLVDFALFCQSYLTPNNFWEKWVNPPIMRESNTIHDKTYFMGYTVSNAINTLRPKQSGRYFADDIFKCIFLNENDWISLKISLKFVPKGPINNIPALVQTMAWRRPGDKPLSEPMMVSLPTHICVTRSQWVNLLWSSDAIWWHRSVANCLFLTEKNPLPESIRIYHQWVSLASALTTILDNEFSL